MKMPSVVHPTTFLINGIKIRVVAYCALTDAQAGKLAMLHCRSRKFTKKDQKVVHTVITQIDKDSVGLL